MSDVRLTYLRVPLRRLVEKYHKEYMAGTLREWCYDSKTDEVLIETLVKDEEAPRE